MIMNSLNGLVSDVVWRIEIKQKQESDKNVQRLAKIFRIMSALEGKWDEKQEEYAYVQKGR
jgi:sensor histidine kinase YesM